MPAFLAGPLLKLAMIAIILGALVTVIGYHEHVVAENARLGVSLKVEEDVNKRDQDELAKIRSDFEKAHQAEVNANAQEQARAAEKAPVDQGITNAKPSDDAELAPVLRDTLKRLYHDAAPVSADRGSAAARTR